MNDSPMVVLEVEGGVVHCVIADSPVRVVVIDRDVEGVEEDRIEVVQEQYAIVGCYNVGRAYLWGGEAALLKEAGDIWEERTHAQD